MENTPNAKSLHHTTMEKVTLSQGKNIYQRPVVDTNSKREHLRPKASDYLKQVKHSLSGKGYQEFTQGLKDFKARVIPFKALLSKISKLFDKVSSEVELLEGFQDFVPRKYNAEYNLLLNTKRLKNKHS